MSVQKKHLEKYGDVYDCNQMILWVDKSLSGGVKRVHRIDLQNDR